MCVTLRATALGSMMRVVRANSIRLIVVVAVAASVVSSGAPALAWTARRSASPDPTPQVDGQAEGVTAAGGRLSVRVDVTMQGGWRGIHVVAFQVLRGDDELDRVSLDVDNSRLIVGGRYLLVGTDTVAVSTHLRVSAAEVVITTGGDHLSVVIAADVVRAIPADARFRLSATDDAGTTEAVVRDLSGEGSGGLDWGTVLTVTVVAVLVGAFLGNLFASRRRPPPRLSVYGAMQRRIDEERSSASGTR